jgi:hypothetical protein
MTFRFTLKIGSACVEFEGSDEAFQSRVSPIVERILDEGKAYFRPASHELELEPHRNAASPESISAAVPNMTVRSIATKLSAHSGSALLNAAVASLAIIKKMDTFTRQDLNSEMKLATGFYKSSYTNNLTNYIETLLKQGTIIEVGREPYSLREAERQALEEKLAQ